MSAEAAGAMTPQAGLRKLVLKFWIGLDGNSIDPDTEIYQLMEEITDDEQEEYFVNRLKQPGTHLMGRVSYEGMAEHFPTATGPVAEVMKQADEYQLWVLPAAAGKGAPLFTGLPHPLALRLVSSTAFPSGILELVYLPAAV